MDKKNDIKKQLRRYLMPNIFATVGVSCYVIADTFFISKASGMKGITALNLILPVFGLIYAMGAMTGIGSATRYSLRKALGDKDVNRYFSNSIIWSLLISLIFVILGIFFTEPVFRLLGADDEIMDTGLAYLRIVLCFAPFFMMNFTVTAFVRNDGAPNIAMAATFASGIFNIIFDYVLMFPLKMGIVGAALATAFSPAVSMLICMIHYFSSKNTVHPVLMKPSLRMLFSSWSLGIVAFVGEISNAVTTFAFNFILLRLTGNEAVAAYGVIANIAIVGTALLNGVAQGLQPLASRVHGEGNRNDETKIYRYSLVVGSLISIAFTALVIIFNRELTALFNSENSAVLAACAKKGIKIYFPGFLIAAFNIVRAGFFSATGRAVESSVISVSRGIVSIVLFAFVLSRAAGITGVWLSFGVSEAFTLLLSFFVSHICGRKKTVA